MSRVKAEKSDVKILNQGKVAEKTKDPETPPPLPTRADHGDYAQDLDATETGQDVNPEQTSQDADIKNTGQDIDPSETAQDADETDNDQDLSWRDCSCSSSSVIKNRFQTFFAWWPSDRVADGI